MSSATRLVQTWDAAATDTLETVSGLRAEDFERETVLPGWRVHDVVAHLAHLEGVCAGLPQPPGGEVADVVAEHPEPSINDLAAAGVAARREHTPADLVDELSRACEERRARLAGVDVDDPEAGAIGDFAVLGWPLVGLLRNRPTDLWVHEQELRLATDQPLRLVGPGADHVVRLLTMTWPSALRRLPEGTSVVLRTTDGRGMVLAAEVGEGGRAVAVDAPDDPSATLEMTEQTWLLLGSSRLDPSQAEVTVTGDEEVARRVLGQLEVMP